MGVPQVSLFGSPATGLRRWGDKTWESQKLALKAFVLFALNATSR